MPQVHASYHRLMPNTSSHYPRFILSCRSIISRLRCSIALSTLPPSTVIILALQLINTFPTSRIFFSPNLPLSKPPLDPHQILRPHGVFRYLSSSQVLPICHSSCLFFHAVPLPLKPLTSQSSSLGSKPPPPSLAFSPLFLFSSHFFDTPLIFLTGQIVTAAAVQ